MPLMHIVKKRSYKTVFVIILAKAGIWWQNFCNNTVSADIGSLFSTTSCIHPFTFWHVAQFL